MQKQYRLLIILATILGALSIGISHLYRAKYTTEYSVRDPDSGQIILYNSATTNNKGLVVLTSEKLLDDGLSESQFAAFKQGLATAITELYDTKYSLASVNSASIVHSPADNSYRFKVRLGDVSSSQYVFVTATITTPSTMQVVVKDSAGSTLKKINKTIAE